MLGAILVILSLIAGAAYVAKVGTVFTLLFIGAVVFMAYKRLPLIAFTVVFTLLLAGYTWNPWEVAPSGIWKGFLWVLLAALWLFNLRPLRKAIISRPVLKDYMRMLPSMSQTE
jgi:acyl-CoA dehydrogenase